MAKPQQQFVCNSCGNVTSKWAGKCDACNEWGSISEEAVSQVFSISKGKKSNNSKIEYHSLSASDENLARLDTKIEELNRVLGGGLVTGSATLVGGDPGIGKSTILLQMVALLAQNNNKCVYITGEESTGQVALRAKRLGLDKAPVEIASATNVDDIIASLKTSKPNVVIIDSIQTMFVPAVDSSPGTVSQVRFSAHELINAAKAQGFCLILVGHVTKDGQIAGPRVLEHMVDTVLYFEGEKGYNFRILRAVKNRFGPANEIGVFEMQEKGLVEVKNPSSFFISGKSNNVSGSAIYAGIEGTRPILVEIQALVSPSFLATPRRAVVGWDSNRLAMIIAVLQTRCGLKLFDKEIYLNIAGGIKLTEPAADLAVAAAIISACESKVIPSDTIFFGEVGLSGEVRPVSQSVMRLKEAHKLGFENAVIPTITEKSPIKYMEIKHLAQLLDMLK
jgi:DNA repair protein RadA/Sms